MKIVVLLFALILVAATVTPLIRRDEWWIRIFDFPRGQILGSGIIVLAILFAFWETKTWIDTITPGMLIVALLFQAYRIYPYTPFAPKQVVSASEDQSGPTISILVANVLMSNRSADRLLKIVREVNPDIVLTLEPDAWWEEQLGILEVEWPHAIKKPLDNRYGMLLHSRLELVDPNIKFLVKEGIPSIHTHVRLPSGRLIYMHGLHPEPPGPTEAMETTRRDAELLIVGAAAKDREEPTIVAGDLNDVAWSYTTVLFQKISGLLDPRRGRGMFNSYHAQNPLMRWPLDHIFHSEHFTLDEMARLPAFGSDHFPIYARLALQPSAASMQQTPDADPQDLEIADEKIDQIEQIEPL